MENELGRLRGEERKVIQETRDRVVHEAAELQREIRQAASELRKETSRARIEQARKALATVGEQLDSEVWQAKTVSETEGETAGESRIAVGDTVWLREANLQATVLSISEESQQIEVQAGRTRIRLSMDGVQEVTPSSGKVTLGPVTAIRKPSGRPVSVELDLRGKRADEIEPVLDSYLNDASLANLSELRIIHGVGTGTVRQIARDLLAYHPLVKSFRSGKTGEGGEGATIVSL